MPPRAVAGWVRRSLLELIVTCSVVSLAAGAGMAWLPAGPMLAGALGLAGCWLYVRGARRGLG